MKPFFIALIIGLLIGWFGHGYLIEPEKKEVIKEIIRIDTVKPPPIIRTKIQWRTQLPQDPNEPTTYKYRFDEDSIKFTVVIESQIEPIDITVTDFIVTPSKIVLIDTLKVKVTEYYEKTDSLSNIRTMIAVSGAMVTGYEIAKENYIPATVIGCSTFAVVYFWDEILKIWRFL